MSSTVNNCLLDDTKSIASDKKVATETDSLVHTAKFLSRFYHSTIDLKCENDVLDTDRILGGNLRDEKRKRGTKGSHIVLSFVYKLYILCIFNYF